MIFVIYASRNTTNNSSLKLLMKLMRMSGMNIYLVTCVEWNLSGELGSNALHVWTMTYVKVNLFLFSLL